ncbi:hypothetical protein C6P40_000646 [Pichia californica]|uniref:Early meiotic induction protein 1 n=1 Tax=Pichia californica TaxID=460514 RepID=A0A9P7BFT4_9ASCO|nr:hypothetical protein C6P40_000646 [[Candida] californica]
MFWSKKPTSDIKDDDGNHLSKENVSDNANGTGEIQNIINEMIDEDKRRANTLRERAGSRAEALELSKFPKELSCMTALDELMQCMSLGGQIRNYYRYGDLTLCDKQSEKLNFCFSNSLNTQDVKEINVQEFYKQRLVEQLKRGSSEDVWESRD